MGDKNLAGYLLINSMPFIDLSISVNIRKGSRVGVTTYSHRFNPRDAPVKTKGLKIINMANIDNNRNSTSDFFIIKYMMKGKLI